MLCYTSCQGKTGGVWSKNLQGRGNLQDLETDHSINTDIMLGRLKQYEITSLCNASQ